MELGLPRLNRGKVVGRNPPTRHLATLKPIPTKTMSFPERSPSPTIEEVWGINHHGEHVDEANALQRDAAAIASANADNIVSNNKEDAQYQPCDILFKSKNETEPEAWSVEQVGDWLDEIGLPMYRDRFQEYDINGEVLLGAIDDKILVCALHVRIRLHRWKIIEEIKILRKRNNTQSKRKVLVPLVKQTANEKSIHDGGGEQHRGVGRSPLLVQNHVQKRDRQNDKPGEGGVEQQNNTQKSCIEGTERRSQMSGRKKTKNHNQGAKGRRSPPVPLLASGGSRSARKSISRISGPCSRQDRAKGKCGNDDKTMGVITYTHRRSPDGNDDGQEEGEEEDIRRYYRSPIPVKTDKAPNSAPHGIYCHTVAHYSVDRNRSMPLSSPPHHTSSSSSTSVITASSSSTSSPAPAVTTKRSHICSSLPATKRGPKRIRGHRRNHSSPFDAGYSACRSPVAAALARSKSVSGQSRGRAISVASSGSSGRHSTRVSPGNSGSSSSRPPSPSSCSPTTLLNSPIDRHQHQICTSYSALPPSAGRGFAPLSRCSDSGTVEISHPRPNSILATTSDYDSTTSEHNQRCSAPQTWEWMQETLQEALEPWLERLSEETYGIQDQSQREQPRVVPIAEVKSMVREGAEALRNEGYYILKHLLCDLGEIDFKSDLCSYGFHKRFVNEMCRQLMLLRRILETHHRTRENVPATTPKLGKKAVLSRGNEDGGKAKEKEKRRKRNQKSKRKGIVDDEKEHENDGSERTYHTAASESSSILSLASEVIHQSLPFRLSPELADESHGEPTTTPDLMTISSVDRDLHSNIAFRIPKTLDEKEQAEGEHVSQDAHSTLTTVKEQSNPHQDHIKNIHEKEMKAGGGDSGARRQRVHPLRNLKIDIHALEQSEEMRQSFAITESGTFQYNGFAIGRQGIQTVPPVLSPTLQAGGKNLSGSASVQSTSMAHPSSATSLDLTLSHSALHQQLEVEGGACHGSKSGQWLRPQDVLLLDRVGAGAGGVVYRALHAPSLQLLAVKEVRIFDHSQRTQVIRELAALYRTQYGMLSRSPWRHLSTTTRRSRPRSRSGSCPFILSFHDAFLSPQTGTLSLVLEHMDAGSLQDLIDSGTLLEEGVIANVAYRVLKGLSFLHANRLLHRDVKPSNLLINRRGEVKISDFGVACRLNGTDPKATAYLGTLMYMAPERITSQEYSYASDIWSFGLSVLTCALGHYPWNNRARTVEGDEEADGGYTARQFGPTGTQRNETGSRTESPLNPKQMERHPHLCEKSKEDEQDEDEEGNEITREVADGGRGESSLEEPGVGGGFWALTNHILTGKIPDAPPTRFSPECRDFVRSCLVRDPLKRPSASDLLGHPFFTIHHGLLHCPNHPCHSDGDGNGDRSVHFPSSSSSCTVAPDKEPRKRTCLPTVSAQPSEHHQKEEEMTLHAPVPTITPAGAAPDSYGRPSLYWSSHGNTIDSSLPALEESLSEQLSASLRESLPGFTEMTSRASRRRSAPSSPPPPPRSPNHPYGNVDLTKSESQRLSLIVRKMLLWQEEQEGRNEKKSARIDSGGTGLERTSTTRGEMLVTSLSASSSSSSSFSYQPLPVPRLRFLAEQLSLPTRVVIKHFDEAMARNHRQKRRREKDQDPSQKEMGG